MAVQYRCQVIHTEIMWPPFIFPLQPFQAFQDKNTLFFLTVTQLSVERLLLWIGHVTLNKLSKHVDSPFKPIFHFVKLSISSILETWMQTQCSFSRSLSDTRNWYGGQASNANWLPSVKTSWLRYRSMLKMNGSRSARTEQSGRRRTSLNLYLIYILFTMLRLDSEMSSRQEN